jgi:7-cyano-7-deazaguanine synthase
MTLGVLLSGGVDSTALTYWQRPAVAFTLDYGQLPAETEIRAATQICALLQIPHEVLRVDCRSLGSGDLAGRSALAVAPVSEWWPFRNQLLLTLAAMRALAIGVDQLAFGSVADDAAHADGRPAFFQQMNALLQAQEGHVQVLAPALNLTSVQLIREAKVPLELLAWAHSCHVATYACGHCRGCFKHRSVMETLGVGAY